MVKQKKKFRKIVIWEKGNFEGLFTMIMILIGFTIGNFTIFFEDKVSSFIWYNIGWVLVIMFAFYEFGSYWKLPKRKTYYEEV